FFHSADVLKVVSTILAYEINIHYVYPMLVKYNNKIAMILGVEDVNLAAKALHSIGVSTLSQEDIAR
ncbi:MAG: acetolactate synthase, partial [Puniceicoccales bacterium]|nr:acetolactate synthase [Puniceicoccales bacterium]